VTFLSAGIINAVDATLPESFEEASPPENFSGDTGDFAADTTTVDDGSQSLEHTVTDTESAILYDGPDVVQGQNYVVAVNTQSSSAPKLYVYASGSGASDIDAYGAEVNTFNDELRIIRSDGGSFTTLASASYTDTDVEGQYVYLDVKVESGPTVDAEIFGSSDRSPGSSIVSQTYDATGDSTTYTSGALGLGSYTSQFASDSVFLDNLDDVGARPTTAVIDSFEDQDMTDWTDASSFTFTNDTPSGGGSVCLDVDGYSKMKSEPGAGLDNYFPKGDVAYFYIKWDTTVRDFPEVRFGLSSDDECYAVTFDSSGVVLEDYTGGSATTLASASESWAVNQWYEIRVTRDDGTLGGSDNDIDVDIREGAGGTSVATLSANDSTHASSEGVGIFNNFAGSGSESIRYDFFHLP
jgi:hypothetical protein